MTDTIAHPPLPEPAAHMLTDDLKKFKTCEMAAPAFSVSVSTPDDLSEPLFTAQQMREYRDASAWLPIETAPRDGTPIVGWCMHSADAYYREDGGLTDYGARVEGLSHVEDGAHVIAWEDARTESEGWDYQSYTIPGGWCLKNDQDGYTGANPVLWMPLPPAPSEQSGENL